MVDFKNILSDMRKRREESRRKRIQQRAEDMFQVTEHDNQLWFTCNGTLFCPCHLVCEEKDTTIVAFLVTLRNLYVERNIR